MELLTIFCLIVEFGSTEYYPITPKFARQGIVLFPVVRLYLHENKENYVICNFFRHLNERAINLVRHFYDIFAMF